MATPQFHTFFLYVVSIFTFSKKYNIFCCCCHILSLIGTFCFSFSPWLWCNKQRLSKWSYTDVLFLIYMYNNYILITIYFWIHHRHYINTAGVPNWLYEHQRGNLTLGILLGTAIHCLFFHTKLDIVITKKHLQKISMLLFNCYTITFRAIVCSKSDKI